MYMFDRLYDVDLTTPAVIVRLFILQTLYFSRSLLVSVARRGIHSRSHIHIRVAFIYLELGSESKRRILPRV